MSFPGNITRAVVEALQAFSLSHLADMKMAAQLAEHQSALLEEMNKLLEKKAEAVRNAKKDDLAKAQVEFQAALQQVQALENIEGANVNQATTMVANSAKAQQDLLQFASYANEVMRSLQNLVASPI